MIIYFSSTGNSEHIAKRLASELSDKVYSIKEINEIHIKNGEKLGFVFPTYFWRLPSVADEYMKKVKITSDEINPYVFFVSTYGGTCGQSGTYMKRHLKKKGIVLSALYGIKTVDDYTIWYNVGNEEEINDVLSKEKKQLESVISSVKSEEIGDKMKNKMPMIAVCGSKIFYDAARKTKNFNINSSCIGCGICEAECPTNSIKLKEGKPIFINDKCALCLHCVHSCPNFAIHYRNKTQKNGQYKHP